MIFRPIQSGLVVRELRDELMVHVAETDAYHALDARAAAVFRGVDGERDVAAVSQQSGTTIEMAAQILAELSEKGLVAAPTGFDRRSLLRRGALAAGAAGIVTVLAPAEMAAASTAGTRVSIRAGDNVTSYITQAATGNVVTMETVQTTDAPGLRRRASFVVSSPNAAGAGARVSYQSFDTAGVFLRHSGFVLRAEAGSGALYQSDSTFIVGAALNGNAAQSSLQAVNFTGFYIVRDTTAAGSGLSLLAVTAASTQDLKDRASFFIQQPALF